MDPEIISFIKAEYERMQKDPRAQVQIMEDMYFNIHLRIKGPVWTCEALVPAFVSHHKEIISGEIKNMIEDYEHTKYNDPAAWMAEHMEPEELSAEERISQYNESIRLLEGEVSKIGQKIAALRCNRTGTDTLDQIETLEEDRRAKLHICNGIISRKNAIISRSRKVCFRCLEQSKTERNATTREHDGFPICMSHWNKAQKEKVKVEVTSSNQYEQPGSVEERLK